MDARNGVLHDNNVSKNFTIGLNLGQLTEARRELLEVPPNIRGVIVTPPERRLARRAPITMRNLRGCRR